MRLKIFTTFLLAISALALVGYISYEGLNQLMNTLIATSKPDHRMEQFQKLNHLIAEAENNVRIYTITKDPTYLNDFYTTSVIVEDQLDTLIDLAGNDPFLTKKIDTITTLVTSKIHLQNRLIDLKKNQKKRDVYKKVVQEIESLENKPPKIDTIREKVEKKGFFRKIFGSKEETKVKIDTVESKENISKEIASSLTEYEKKEEQLEKKLTTQELSLTRQDKAITDKIVGEISKIEKYFEKINQNKAQKATHTLEETKQLINIIGATSAVLFLILIFIILNDYQIIQSNKKKLEKAKQKAEQLAQAKEEFLSNMSHEIRTPLNAVVGFTEQLSFTSTNYEQKKYIHTIHDASQHLLSIINDILDYSKIEVGKINLEKIPMDIKQCVNTVYEALKPKAREKNLQFHYSIDEVFENQGILGDPVRIKQILFNLIGNAIKFTEQGEVQCIIQSENRNDDSDSSLKIIIRDTGIGISKDKRKLIFGKFDQADSSTTRKYGGTGLGLAIAKQLVELHNGKIDVESKINEGTTFTITLSVELTQLPANTSRQDGYPFGQNQLDLSNTKVLIADDEDYNLMLLENILKKYNAKIYTVYTGHEVMEALNAEDFDLLLLDLQMPDLDGIATTKKIRMSGLEIPIIAVTAAVTEEKHIQCQSAGIDEIIIKPTPEKVLINSLIKYCGNKQPVAETSLSHEKNESTNQENNLNFQYINQLIESDDFINTDMIALYATNLKHTIKILYDSLQSEDFEQIKLSAHKMLPSTRHMGLDNLVNRLEVIEKMAEPPVDTKKMNEELEYFNNLAVETLSTIENYLEYASH